MTAIQPKTPEQLQKMILHTVRQNGWKADLNFIDVSLIKSMSKLFNHKDLKKFNGDISQWDVSNVQDMYMMFIDCAFNGDISSWNTSQVKNMQGMFFRSKFNQDISRWDVSNVESMDSMFLQSDFQGSLLKWNLRPEVSKWHMFNMSALAKNIGQNSPTWEEVMAFQRQEFLEIHLSSQDDQHKEEVNPTQKPRL